MGNGISFHCDKCGYKTVASYGIGFRFPTVYHEIVEAIKVGNYGQKWKELFEHTPGAAINAEMEFYVCAHCGSLANEPNLTMYAPNDPGISKTHNESFSIANPAVGREYVMLYELEKNYRRVKVFVHKCPECGKRMHKYKSGEQLKCPECKTGTMEFDGMLNWD